MAELSVAEMRNVISGILRGADLSTLSSKKIRKQLEEKYNTDFTSRKKEIDNVVMELITVEEQKDANNGNSFDSKADSSDVDSSDDEEVPPPKRAKAPEASGKKSSRNESWDKEENVSKQDSDEEDDEELARKLHAEEIRSRSRAVKKPSKKNSKKEAKSQGGKAPGAKRESTYSRKCALSPELSVVVGADQMARHDVVKKMWEIFRERKLVDPANKQFAFCDEQLLKVFGQKRVRMFGMMKYLKNHIKDIK